MDGISLAGVRQRARSGAERARVRIERLSMFKLVTIAIALSLLLTAVVEIVAAQQYGVSVQVVEDSALGVNPLTDSLDFGDMPLGAGQTRFVTLANDGSRPAYIWIVTLGSVRDLIDVDRTHFVLASGETAQVGFAMQVPPSAPVKRYTGTVHIFRLPYVKL